MLKWYNLGIYYIFILVNSKLQNSKQIGWPGTLLLTISTRTKYESIAKIWMTSFPSINRCKFVNRFTITSDRHFEHFAVDHGDSLASEFHRKEV